MISRRMWLGIVSAFVCASTFALADDKKAEVGKDAPDFELTAADGKKHKLSEYKDKIVVLEWLNKDCPVCQKAMPMMLETQKKYAEKGVIWLGIDSTFNHTAKDNVDWAKEKSIPYVILMDTDGAVGHLYGAQTTPHMYIINKGKLVYMGAHDDKKGRNYISESLDAVLAGKDVPSPTTNNYGCTVKYKKK